MNTAQNRRTVAVPADFDMETSPTIRCAPILPDEEVRRPSAFSKLLRFFGIAAALCLFTGCYTVKVRAPKNTTVVVADNTPSVGETRTKRTWYMGRGIISLNDNSIEDVIEPECTKVGVSTEMSAVDTLMEVGMTAAVMGIGAAVTVAAPPLGALVMVGSLVAPYILPTARTTSVTCYEKRQLATPQQPPPGFAPANYPPPTQQPFQPQGFPQQTMQQFPPQPQPVQLPPPPVQQASYEVPEYLRSK